MYEKVILELAHYDKGVHRLYPPASEVAIAEAEKQLNLSFSPSYRNFFTKWNGGLLFAKEFFDIVIWSVKDTDTDVQKEYDYDIVRDNKILRRIHDLPEHLLAVASCSDGSLICLDVDHGEEVVLWLKDEKIIETRWDSFEAWLTHELVEGATVYDYHGDER